MSRDSNAPTDSNRSSDSNGSSSSSAPTVPTRNASGDSTPTRQSTSQSLIRPPGQERQSATPRPGTPRPIVAPPPKRDRTPTGGVPRGVPKKGFQQSRVPTIIVIGLLVIAAIVAAILLSNGDSKNASPPETSATAPDTAATAGAASDGPVSIANVVSFDPGDPQGGTERPQDVGFVTDGNPSNDWKTSCYNDKYFNGKPGVGLIVQLSAAATGTLNVVVNSAPYQLAIYASDAETAPETMAAWGTPIQPKSASTSAGTISATIATPARFLLVSMLEAGQDDSCTKSFPYRGRIGEVTFATT